MESDRATFWITCADDGRRWRLISVRRGQWAGPEFISARPVIASASSTTTSSQPPSSRLDPVPPPHSILDLGARSPSTAQTKAKKLIQTKRTPAMPPLLKTYFNPHHRQFLSTLFTATFLGSVLVVAFPCPVRPTDGSSSLVNESAVPAVPNAGESGEGRRRGRDEIVVMMNERSGGRRRFMSED